MYATTSDISIGTTKRSLHVSAFYFVQTQMIGYFWIPQVIFLGGPGICIGIFSLVQKVF